jgi:hypothetical protein
MMDGNDNMGTIVVFTVALIGVIFLIGMMLA